MTDSKDHPHASKAAPDLIALARQEFQSSGAPQWDNAVTGEATGDIIGPYRLLEKLGEGGMGTVWMAQQSEPLKRMVALKIIKLGMDTKEVIARFDVERQALAMMEHPHIAKVLDGGATESGRPFFVMELVRGTTITEYCNQAKLALPEKLRLFARICMAIQHAHQKGIIHRDIKPSNVLVTLHDGVPVPKVIDFGIAKATSAERTQHTLFTKYAQMIGTPEYMAPEQAELSGLDIDTRADVYSLGVLLYELLTGSLPYDMRGAMEKGYDELLRTIRETPPVKPSTRASTRGALATAASSSSPEGPAELSRQLRGDLDWIILKALEKDRQRRYDSAAGLAADVTRYLEHEPVLAVPPSPGYRFRKFVQRRRKTVLATTTILLLVLMGSIGTGVGWWNTALANRSLDIALSEKSEALENETKERKRALTAEADAKHNAERARGAERETSMRAEELEDVVNFQAQQLGQLNIRQMGERLERSLLDATQVERREALQANLVGVNFSSLSLQLLDESLFDPTLRSIDERFEKQPLVQAQLLQSTAETMTRLGLFQKALEPHKRALALRRESQGDDHPSTVNLLHLIGVALLNQRRVNEAEPYIREALERTQGVLGDDDPSVLLSLNNLGGVLISQGKLAEAEPYYIRALEGRRRVLGEDHRSTLRSIASMGALLRMQGRLPEAEDFLRESYAGRARTMGEDHRDALDSAAVLGAVLLQQNELEEAELWLRKSVVGNSRVLGEHHQLLLNSKRHLGNLLRLQGRLPEAEEYLQQALDGAQATGRMGTADATEALRLMELLLSELVDSERRAAHPAGLRARIGRLGIIMQLRGKYADAESTLVEALDVILEEEPDVDWRLAAILGDLGAAVAAQGRRDEAEALFLESLETLMAIDSIPAGERALCTALVPPAIARLIEFYDDWHASHPTGGYGARATSWREQLQGWTQDHGE